MNNRLTVTNTPNMRVEGTIWNKNQNQVLPKNVSMEISFSCKDEFYNKYYYKASTIIPDTKGFYDCIWNCERVG